MKNILVGIDFDDSAGLLIEQGADWAEKFGAKLWLVHVADPDPDFVGYEPGPQYIRDSRATELTDAHKLMIHYAEKLQERNIQAEGLLVKGAIAETILSEAEKLSIDLMVIGHHAHGLLYRAFIGSTSSSLISRTRIPLLLVPVEDV